MELNEENIRGMMCFTCLFHLQITDRIERHKCTIRPPVKTKGLGNGHPDIIAFSRCPFWTDPKTGEQPLRALAPDYYSAQKNLKAIE